MGRRCCSSTAGRRTISAGPSVAEGSLREEFRLVAYDLHGHGMSEAPLEPEHYTDGKLWADDVVAIIDELRLDRPVLVGWSLRRRSSSGDYVAAPTGRIATTSSAQSLPSV